MPYMLYACMPYMLISVLVCALICVLVCARMCILPVVLICARVYVLTYVSLYVSLYMARALLMEAIAAKDAIVAATWDVGAVTAAMARDAAEEIVRLIKVP